MRIVIISSIAAVFWALTPASANGCEEQARALAQAENARLLAVSTKDGKCIVKLLIERNNEPPTRKTVVLDRR